MVNHAYFMLITLISCLSDSEAYTYLTELKEVNTIHNTKREEKDAYFGTRCDLDTPEITQNIINTTKRNISYLQHKLPSHVCPSTC